MKIFLQINRKKLRLEVGESDLMAGRNVMNLSWEPEVFLFFDSVQYMIH